MDLWLQEKYILLLSNRLERFQRVSQNLFKMRCPKCGDSQKNEFRTRGYFYQKKLDYYFHCHNCGAHSRFEFFLKEIDPSLYFEMKKESLSSIPGEQTKYVQSVKKVESTDNVLSKITRISELPNNHSARKYLDSRRIPQTEYENLYHVDDFRDFVNSLEPNKLKSEKHAIPRIIIPFLDKNDHLFGFQGRSLDPDDDIRYISIILDDSLPKAFNLNKINFNERYYVFEGPFDAMFIPNSMAACGSDVLSVLNSIGCNRDNGVIVFDNEPRNHEIVRNIEKSIKFGWTVCVWPKHWQFKDINEAIENNLTPSQIKYAIDDNSYNGTVAMLELNHWRRDE